MIWFISVLWCICAMIVLVMVEHSGFGVDDPPTAVGIFLVWPIIALGWLLKHLAQLIDDCWTFGRRKR